MGTGGDLLEIGTADSAGMDPNQQLARADLRDGNSFQADIAHTAVNRRQHGRGDRLALPLDLDLSGNAHEGG